MHAKDKLSVRDHDLAGTGRQDAYEYDGLVSGELAWIMSKQFLVRPSDNTNWPSLVAQAIEFASATSNLITPFTAQELIRGDGNNESAGVINRIGDYYSAAPRAQTSAQPDGAINAFQGDPAGMYGMSHNRMQRLAYTNWVEAFFEQRIARQRFDLTALRIVDGDGEGGASQNAFLESDIAFYSSMTSQPRAVAGLGPPPAFAAGAVVGTSISGYLNGSTVLSVPDLAYALQATHIDYRPAAYGTDDPSGMQVQVPMMQGLHLMETGPFLRSFGADHRPVDIRLPNQVRSWVYANSDVDTTPKLASVDRHLGSQLAQKALYCALKKHGVFNWVPDGIVLSKLENGPDTGSDAMFDARDGQLFNIGVQGPCITKTWAGNPAMRGMPGDKVFVLIVADVSYEVAGPPGDPAAAGMAAGAGFADLGIPAYDAGAGIPGRVADEIMGRAARNVAGERAREALDNAANRVVQANAALTAEIQRETHDRQTLYGTVPTEHPNAAIYNARVDKTQQEAQRRVVHYRVAPAARAAVDALKAAITTANSPTVPGPPVVANPAASPSYSAGLFGNMVDGLNLMHRHADVANERGGPFAAAKSAAVAAHSAYASQFDLLSRIEMLKAGANDFQGLAAKMRNGERTMRRAEMSNIRLMRATSSYLSNTSHFDPLDPKSRCGLKCGFRRQGVKKVGDTDSDFKGVNVINAAYDARSREARKAAAITATEAALATRTADQATAAATAAAEAGTSTEATANAALVAANLALVAATDTRDTALAIDLTDPAASDAALAAVGYPERSTYNPTINDSVYDAAAAADTGDAAAKALAGVTAARAADDRVGVGISADGTREGTTPRPANTGSSEFIVGAWCIGTVMDSAASRAIGQNFHGVRTAPHSMAINVNVNVEWWDADRLYDAYMDKDRGVLVEAAEDPRLAYVDSLLGPTGPHRDGAGDGVNIGIGANFSGTGPVLRPQRTVFMRTEVEGRSLDEMVDEMLPRPGGKGYATSRNTEINRVGDPAVLAANRPGTPAAAIANRDAAETVAYARINTGQNEYEGRYIQPNARGVNTDPKGERVYDLRTPADNAYYRSVGPDGIDNALPETRHWAAATFSRP